MSNLLSNVSLQVNVTVVSAVPSDLQLSLVTEDELLPTCVSGQARDEMTSVSVFRGVPVVFDASVATGANLTFEWTFSDDRAGNESVVDKLWCVGRNCSTSSMVSDCFTCRVQGLRGGTWDSRVREPRFES